MKKDLKISKDHIIASYKERLLVEEEKEDAAVSEQEPLLVNAPFRKLMDQYLSGNTAESEEIDQLTQVAITAISQGVFYIHTGGIAVSEVNIPTIEDVKGTEFIPLYSYGEETDVPIRILDLAPYLMVHEEVRGIWIDPMEQRDYILPTDFLMEAFCELADEELS